MFKRILVPIDPDEIGLGRAALDAATSIARSDGAQLRLVSVVKISHHDMLEYLPADYDAVQQKKAAEKLALVAASIELPAANVSANARIGRAHHEVLEEAKDFGADLIVMSSHDPTAQTYVLGSNATQVVRHAHCSVLVIRHAAAKPM